MFIKYLQEEDNKKIKGKVKVYYSIIYIYIYHECKFKMKINNLYYYYYYLTYIYNLQTPQINKLIEEINEKIDNALKLYE